MSVVPFFGVGLASSVPNVSAQKRVNVYLEFRREDDKTRIVALGTPGLDLLINSGGYVSRGNYVLGDYLYFVAGTNLYRMDYQGTISASLGTLLTQTGRVAFSDNGIELIVVDGTYGYILTLATLVFARITDVDFPGADTVTFLDGRFFVNDPGTGAFYGSAAYNGASWSATDFATAESSPDQLMSVSQDRGGLVLWGTNNAEFWQNIGGSGFPYAATGGANAEYGLAARFSLAQWENGQIGLLRNKLGQLQVGTLNGFTINRVSDDDWETEVNDYATTSDAIGSSYRIGGHPFYLLNFPTADRSWLYDGATQQWTVVNSWGLNRHRVEQAIPFAGMVVGSDFENGKFYTYDLETYDENGDPLVREIISRHQIKAPTYEIHPINMLQLDFERGVGIPTGQGSDPQVMLQVSKDGGHTWGNERWTSIGAIGNYKARARFPKLGIAFNGDWTFRTRFSDPAKFALLGAAIQ